jgi:hypothetical protein
MRNIMSSDGTDKRPGSPTPANNTTAHNTNEEAQRNWDKTTKSYQAIRDFYNTKIDAEKIAEFVKKNKRWKKNQDWKEVGNLERDLKSYNRVKDTYRNYDDDSKMLDFYEKVVKSKVGQDILAASNLNAWLSHSKNGELIDPTLEREAAFAKAADFYQGLLKNDPVLGYLNDKSKTAWDQIVLIKRAKLHQTDLAGQLNTALIEKSLKKKEKKFGQLLGDSKGKSILGKLKDSFKRTINWNKGSAKITPTNIITK